MEEFKKFFIENWQLISAVICFIGALVIGIYRGYYQYSWVRR